MAFLTAGSIYFSTPIETILSAATPAKAAGNTTIMQVAGFSMPADNRLQCETAVARMYELGFNGSGHKGGGGGTLAYIALFKNGALIPGSAIERTITNASDEGAFSVKAHVSLAIGDYVELWVESDSGDNLTIGAGVLSAIVIG